MSPAEQKPAGPWGQTPGVDKAGREAFERELEQASRVAIEVAEITEKLKKEVREGDKDAGILALDHIFFPDTVRKYRDSPLTMIGFVTTVLEEVGKKYGWSVVNALLGDARIKQYAEPLRQLLKQKDTGWSK